MRVNLILQDGKVLVKPAQYLADGFSRYLEACRVAVATYRQELKAQICEIESVPILKEALRMAGFNSVSSSDLEREMSERFRQSQAIVDEAKNRLDAVDAELKKRGLFLFNFQKIGLTWLAPRMRALLADEMGLGKTIQALIALPAQASAIIVCPASVKGVWEAECLKWRPDLTPTILSGRGSWVWPQAGEVVITNFDILPDDLVNVTSNDDLFSKLAKPVDGTVLISDECHALKNSKSLRYQRFYNIADAVEECSGRIWLLSGTPILNDPPELRNVLQAARLFQIVFGTWSRFVKLFNGMKTGYGYSWGEPTSEVPGLLKRVMLRRVREEVLPDLPTKIWKNVIVEITDNDKKETDESIEGPFDYEIIDGIGDESMSQSVGQISKARERLAQAKIDALVQMISDFEDLDEPIIVFSAHRSPVDTLAERPGWSSITGDTPQAKRQEIVEAFQGGRLKGVALTIQAGGVGITLTKAHQAIFVDLAWTPALNKQAEDRLCRIGQTRGVIIRS